LLNTKRLFRVTVRHVVFTLEKNQNKHFERKKDSQPRFEGKDDPIANEERQKAQVELNEAMEATEPLNTFYQDVSTCWATSESCVLGYVIISPPINVGVGKRQRGDWAVIKI
jgi:hypothetical protein